MVLLHRAGVTANIDKPGMYAGLPTQPLSAYMRNTVMLKNLSDLRKKVLQLEKKLAKG